MSDYQTVTVTKIEGNEVTVHVHEHWASRALSFLFDSEEAMPEDWLKIGAMLLFDEKGRMGEVWVPEEDDEAFPEPGDLIARVTKIEATLLGNGDSGSPCYQAVLQVEVKSPKHAALFEVDESFGSVADPHGDFEEIFG